MIAISAFLTNTVIPWVSGEVFDAYKEKYITPGLKNLLFAPEQYGIRLNAVIRKTIEKYEDKFPPTGNFPFYHHKETFAQLSKFILFKDEGDNILEQINFGEIENIEKPTREQVEHFYNFFVAEVKADEKLTDFYIEESYRSKIFEIYREISLVKYIIEDFINAIPKSEDIIKSWIDQIYLNLQKIKGATALAEIDRFETEMLAKNAVSNHNKAFMYFVKGLCLNENSKPKEAADYFEQACVLAPENKSYQAWHLYFQYLFNFSNEVVDKINTAVKDNAFDPLLNGAITLEELKKPSFSFKSVNISIQNNLRYKRVIYVHYLKNGLVSHALEYFKSDKTDINNELAHVAIDNYMYLNFHLQLYFINLLTKYPNHLFFSVNQDLRNSHDLETYKKFIECYLEGIKGSERNDLKGLFEYLLEIVVFFQTGNKSNLDSAHVIYQRNKETITPYYFGLLRLCYSQAGEFNTALKLFDEREHAIEEYYFKAILCYRAGDEKGRLQALETYLLKLDRIDDLNIESVIDSILAKIDLNSLNSFYERVSKNEIVVDGVYRDMIIATKGIKKDVYKDESIKLLQNNFKKICDDANAGQDLLTSYCRILMAYEQWVGIVGLLEKQGAHTFKTKSLLIDALHHSKLNSVRLVKMLEEVRESKEHPIAQYFIWEINLKAILGLWDKIEDISKEASQFFPEDRAFDFYLALAYANQDKTQDFLSLIEKLNILEFRFPNFQTLVQALLKFGQFSLAVELAFNYAAKNKDAAQRAFFFNLYMFHYDRVGHSLPVHCEVGNFVTIQSANNTMTVDNDSNTLIFEKLIGKKVGETISLSGTMTKKEVVYTVTAIHHKYDMMIKDIQKEAENPELTGLPMQAFQFKEGGTLEDWNKQLMDLFGSKGDETNVLFEKTINQYKTGAITFLQLTRLLFDDDVFKTYLNVTQWPEIGFRSIPANLFKMNRADANNKPCIDLTTLILFSEISKSKGIEFKNKFIISQHTASYINELLAATENEIPSDISLNISSTQVLPAFNQKEKHEQKLQLLRDCKSWMDNNCEALTSTEKLNIIVHIQDEKGTVNDLVLSYMDTMALTIEHKTFLISDEKISFGTFRQSNQIICPEYYLLHFSKNIDTDTLFEYLARKNFVGIRIPETKVGSIVDKLITPDISQENLFQNISVQSTFNSHNVPVIILIMHKLLETPIPEDKKIEIIRVLFEKLFEGIYTNKDMLQNLIDLVALSLLRVFYSDTNKLGIIKEELFSVLRNNGVKINFS